VPNPRPLALALALALVLAACSGAAPSRGTAQGSGSASPSGVASTALPESSAAATEAPTEPGGTPSDEPAGTEPVASVDPGGSASPSQSTDPSSSPGTTNGSADKCSGSAANREFYANVASTVDWTVLCAVQPKGWYVSAGSYRLANGGKLVIGYKGPAGATLDLSEGAFCSDASGCLPPGSDGGEVPLGPMTGTLVSLANGDYAIVVDRGLNPSWQLVTHGLDEATTLAFGAAMAVVAR
jgi:hypothetical protein